MKSCKTQLQSLFSFNGTNNITKLIAEKMISIKWIKLHEIADKNL